LCLLGRLGGGTRLNFGSGGLDDTHSNGLSHVPDSKPSKGSELTEGLHAHGLAGDQLYDGSVTRLDELGVVFSGLASTTVNLKQLWLGQVGRNGSNYLLFDLCEFAGNVGGVTVKDRAVTIGDLTRVVEDDDLSSEVSDTRSGLVLGV